MEGCSWRKGQGVGHKWRVVPGGRVRGWGKWRGCSWRKGQGVGQGGLFLEERSGGGAQVRIHACQLSTIGLDLH